MARKASGLESPLPSAAARPPSGAGVPVSADSGRRPAPERVAWAETGVRASSGVVWCLAPWALSGVECGTGRPAGAQGAAGGEK